MTDLRHYPKTPRLHFGKAKISYDTVGGLRWSLAPDAAFAQSWRYVPITHSELHRIAQSYVIGFLNDGERLQPVACGNGSVREKVDPDQAAASPPWSDEYLPLLIRLHPFCRDETEDAMAVYINPRCIGLGLTYDFFDDHGNESAAVALIRKQMQIAANGFKLLAEAAQRLALADVLVPFDTVAPAAADEASLMVISAERLQQNLSSWLPIWAKEAPVAIELALIAEFSLKPTERVATHSWDGVGAQTEHTDALMLTPLHDTAAWLDEDDALRF